MDAYVRALAGPPRYSERLREIDSLRRRHAARLAVAGAQLDRRYGAGDLLSRARLNLARAWDFGDLNQLIDQHNRRYPIERGLAVDPSTGHDAVPPGSPYPMAPAGVAWALRELGA